MFLPLTTSERLERKPVLIGCLIGACAIVFLLTSMLKKNAAFVLAFAFTTVDHSWGLFTYTFLHADLSHLAGNMFFLWTFGRLIEARWGHVLAAFCFVLAGAAGAVLHGLAHRGAPVPLVGASGAIAGLAGAVVVALPNARFNRLFSPLLWPVTPVVAIVRRRGWKALLDLLPFYGWVLKLERGLPAFFVLPAWLSLDLFSMMLQPATRTSFACHVGGAFAGMAFAALMRATKLPDQMRAIEGRVTREASLEDEDEGLAPSLRARRAANRPSRFPEGRLSGFWFVFSLLTAAGLMAASFRVSQVATDFREKREGEAHRKKLLASSDASQAPFDEKYEHMLFTVAFPKAFWACGGGPASARGRDSGRAETGPCAGHSMPDNPNVGAVELIHPDAMESVFVMAVRYGVDKRSELVAAVADGVTAELKDKAKWRLVDTHTGTCHGEYSVESIIEIGSGEGMLRMWSCTFSKGLDLFLYAYVIPETLRLRDEKTLARILEETQLAAPPTAVPSNRPAAASLSDAPPTATGPAAALKPPPPGGGDGPSSPGEVTSCAPGEVAYRVDGKLQCYRPVGEGNTTRPRPLPARPRRR